MKITPPYSAVRKMAFGITLAASGVSSHRVVTASKPRNEKHKIVAPVMIGSKCAFSLMKGCRLHTVPSPSPLCRPRTTRKINTTMIAIWAKTNRVLKLATKLTLFRLMAVMMITKPTTHTHGGTSGNSAVR
ncbi:hypothetical protein D3C78_1648320 [compost metagenome]